MAAIVVGVRSPARQIMSCMRHLASSEEPAVRGYAVTHPRGQVTLPTQPGWHQVIYTVSGSLVANTARESWAVPPHRALCVGDDATRLQVGTSRPTAVRCLYLDARLGAVPASIRVVNLPPLARELLLHAVVASPLWLDHPSSLAIVTLLIDQLSALPTAALQLPLPADGRAMALAERLMAEPALSLTEAIAPIAASRRTMERRFRLETGLTLAGWQRRARALAAIDRMGDGSSVTEVAIAVGYATPSSFVAAFRGELGVTPRQLMGSLSPPR
jgi:AraC-like DNA-binding protein